jgi:glycosyltransferase involved in cell wall biosynthesis
MLLKNLIKPLLPPALRRGLRDAARRGRYWLLRHAGRPGPGKLRVSMGHLDAPGGHKVVSGGMVKFHLLRRVLPHSYWRFNILYLGSSSLPEDYEELLRVARKKGAKIVFNQNGVGYTAWAGAHWEQVNRPMQRVLQAADYVFYQSQFCKLSADRYLGPPPGPWEILYNPVDTANFRPPAQRPAINPLVLLSAGSANSFYRFEAAVQTLDQLRRQGIKARLMVAGRLAWREDPAHSLDEARRLVQALGLKEWVDLLPPYTQASAPALFHQAHMLLHTQVNDPCPMVVLEAMASGLPVVYPASGGAPELVGGDAGVGIACHTGWERLQPPAPEHLAQAVLQVADDLERYSLAARERAVARFDLAPWCARHQQVFSELLA